MTIGGFLSASALLVLLSDGLRAIDHGEVPWRPVCRGLNDTFRGAIVSYVEVANDRDGCFVRACSEAADSVTVAPALAPTGLQSAEDEALHRRRTDQRPWQEQLVASGQPPHPFAMAGIPIAQLDQHALVVTLVRADVPFTSEEMSAMDDLQHALIPFDAHVRRLKQTRLLPDIRRAPLDVHPGEHARPPALTRRELEVLELLSEGLMASTIATRLAVSSRTVHAHLGSAYRKLSTHDRLSAVNIARGWGFLREG